MLCSVFQCPFRGPFYKHAQLLFHCLLLLCYAFCLGPVAQIVCYNPIYAFFKSPQVITYSSKTVVYYDTQRYAMGPLSAF
jgi:hypothetical protein